MDAHQPESRGHWADRQASQRNRTPERKEYSFLAKAAAWMSLIALFLGGPILGVLLYFSAKPAQPDLRSMHRYEYLGVSFQLPGNWQIDSSQSELWGDSHGIAVLPISKNAYIEFVIGPHARTTSDIDREIKHYLDFMMECWEGGRARTAPTLRTDGWMTADMLGREFTSNYRIAIYSNILTDGRLIAIRSVWQKDHNPVYAHGLETVIESIATR